MIRSPKSDLREYPLKHGINTLGRNDEVDIYIDDDSASRYHAQISYNIEENYLEIKDLKSTNGTFVNGKQIDTPLTLLHKDQVRIGRHLLTVISNQERNATQTLTDQTKSVVTGDLMISTIDNYAVLLHDIGRQLVSIPELDRAFTTISQTIKQMIGAEDCLIVLSNDADTLIRYDIPQEILDEVIEQHSATIFSIQQTSIEIEENSRPHSMLLAPVIIEEEVAGLIWATKRSDPFGFSYESDLQLVIAVSHQVGLSIQRNRVEQELLHNAYHDSLTGLSNRALFVDRLRESLVRAQRNTNYKFAVLFMDIDNFKVINDSLGHAAGDKLLIAMAQRLVDNLRKLDAISRFDTVARFGGDEFAILLDDIVDERSALLVANRLHELLSEPFSISGKSVYVTNSIGITINTLGYEQPEDMLRDADIAMYRAKELGKSRVEIYDNVMHNMLINRLSLETDLRKGIKSNEFKLYYQPIISLKTNKIVGLEGLLRWHSKERGLMYPGQFLMAMDTTGLLNSMDEWVLNQAFRDAVKINQLFPTDPPIYLSVNMSSHLIKNPELCNILDQYLTKHKLKASSIKIEITERDGVDDDEKTLEMLKSVKEMGVGVLLDDFGTGYSTLSYLLQFPVESLKIDQTFVHMLTRNRDGYKIIETLKALSSHLGINLIAEGIETKEQLELLKELGCDFGQGYLFSKAIEFKAATDFIKKSI
ncbi:MAG TPA: EAL domain-containing protein [Anaerolineales bacterium]|nr:EAL domain-containing protein [Anaerolineales bacterium]